jgi:hypothetical protein
MGRSLIIFFFLLLTVTSRAQPFKPGEYSSGLKLAYDKESNKLTGYFENYSGWDEETQNPKFACIFYIEGLVKGNKFNISTYYPSEDTSEIIKGTIEFSDSGQVTIKLPEEHGGCWNVEHFADRDPATFSLEQQQKWIRISYIANEKAFFFKEKAMDKKLKAYVVKDDFVCIDKIEGEWAHCIYFGKKTTIGWIQLKDIK